MTPAVGGLIFFGIALILGAGTLLLILEATLLETGRRPITTYTRNAVVQYPARTVTTGMLFVFVTGLLVAHFFWDAGCG